MKPVFLLLVCVQVLLCGAGGNDSPLASVDCNDPDAEEAADLSLDWLNENLKDGFILRLQRINSVHKESKEDNSTVYYLALDVVETQCPVLSRENWRDCEPKQRHEAVIGQCKLVFHLKTPEENSALYKYDCTLKPDPSNMPCAGCLMSKPLNDPRFQRLAEKSLTKFNKDSNVDFHYALGNITKGTVQVVAGAIYRVEYVIHETDCNKSETTGDLSLCQPSDSKSAHTGYCKSEGYAHWSNPDEPTVKVFCKIFESEDEANSEEVLDHPGYPGGGKRGKKHGHSDHKHGHKHGRKHGHEHGRKHGRKHSHKHDHDHSESHEHRHHHHHHHHHHHRHNDTKLGCAHPDFFDKPFGRITYVTVESTALPGIQERGKPRFSVGSSFPEGSRKPKGDRPPPPSFATGENTGPPHLCKPSRPFLHRFPEQASTSAQCPGLIKNHFLGAVPPGVPHSPQEPTLIPK